MNYGQRVVLKQHWFHGGRGVSGIGGEGVHGLDFWRGSPPSPMAATYEFGWFFETLRLGGAGLVLSDVDLFASGVDNWGAAVVGGHFDQAVQAQAIGAHDVLLNKFSADATAKFFLDQAMKTLIAIPASVQNQAAKGSPAKPDQTPSGAPMSAGAAVATGFGFFGIAIVLGIGYLAFAGGKK